MSLKEGDYLQIGDDVRLYFDHKADRNIMRIGISAPRHVPIQRRKVYEQSVAAQAATGDGEAWFLSEQLKLDYEKTRRKVRASRARRDEQEQRMAAGEIKRYNA
jgi:sRNA-binding carbon storage regulator CsrA